MKTLLILVGKTNGKLFAAGIDDYVGRINHYMPMGIVTVPELKSTKNLTQEQQKEAEGRLILNQLQPSDTVVLLDEHGKEPRSVEFARWLEHKRQTSRRLVFVIGGLRVLSAGLYARQRAAVPFPHDFLPPDGAPYLCRTALQSVHHNTGRAVSPRVKPPGSHYNPYVFDLQTSRLRA